MTHRRARMTTAAVAVAVLLGAAACEGDVGEGRADVPTSQGPATGAAPDAAAGDPSPPDAPATGAPRDVPHGGERLLPPPASPLGAADGYLPDGAGVSPFADGLPALDNLTPELRAAVQAAARAAADDGVELLVTSGWRSAAYQQWLFDEAVREHGSAAEARRFVLAPEESEHVTGEAVDVGPTEATSWLSRHGSDHGLCQTYANESWHYELATTPGGECPAQLPDASAG